MLKPHPMIKVFRLLGMKPEIPLTYANIKNSNFYRASLSTGVTVRAIESKVSSTIGVWKVDEELIIYYCIVQSLSNPIPFSKASN